MKIKKSHIIIALAALWLATNFPMGSVFTEKATSWTELQQS